ncbi:MAG: YCF48-related protein [Chloroflexota bacterium]
MLHTLHKSSIAPGGSVFDIVLDHYGETWLATESGLWRGQTGNWQPLPQAMPLLHINALTCIDDISAHSSLLFAGGAPNSIVYSYDTGASWYTARIDAIESPITCFAPSPNFVEDRVILAGTLNDGVLRSSDGGRNWRLANFGLQDFAILSIVVAPVWHSHEMAFLITDEGVYRSPNGGRAWKRVLGDITPRALAINPHFATNQTVYVADEQEKLYRSTDGGKTWHSVKAINSVPSGINCLWCGPDTPTTLIAGTQDGSIYRSLDDGHTWFPIAQFAGSVLTLTEREGRIHIGLYDDGLAFSIDQGHTWQQDRSFATRDITRIVHSADRHLLAFGPTGGLWQSEVQSTGLEAWTRITTFGAHHTLLSAAHPHRDVLYVATDNGIIISTDGGVDWHDALSPSSAPFVSVISSNHEPNAVWAGTTQSDIWHSIDYGQTWHCLSTIEEDHVLLAFELATFYSDQTPIAVTYNASEQQIIVWRSIGGGRRWQQWLTMPRSPDAEGIPRVHLATQPRVDGLAVWVAFDNQVWNGIDQPWEYYVFEEQHVVALTCVPGTPITLVATNQQFYGCADRELWEVMGDNLLGTDMMDFCAPVVGDLIGLGRGGVVWIQSYVR